MFSGIPHRYNNRLRWRQELALVRDPIVYRRLWLELCSQNPAMLALQSCFLLFNFRVVKDKVRISVFDSCRNRSSLLNSKHRFVHKILTRPSQDWMDTVALCYIVDIHPPRASISPHTPFLFLLLFCVRKRARRRFHWIWSNPTESAWDLRVSFYA